MSQSERDLQNPSRNTRAPALDSESARGEQTRWKSFGMAAGPQPIALITVSALVTTATFWSAKLIDALCQSAFIVEQQSSGTIMKNPLSAPVRAVCSTDILVQAPVLMI